MDNLQLINFHCHHRSRERIKDMGEVFTPGECVHRMLALFNEKIWADEHIIFFEPTCGHGNFVVSILEKRVNSLLKKYRKAKLETPLLYAIANALNTLWAIDVSIGNIEITRKRVFDFIILRLLDAEFNLSSENSVKFLAHILCTILWQIQENETLSSLSDQSEAIANASKIKISKEWLKKNGHRPIIFEIDWCEYYRQVSTNKTVPLPFQRAIKFIETKIKHWSLRGYDEFDFASESLSKFIKNFEPSDIKDSTAL